MDLENPNFYTTKLLTTWWDLLDRYLLAVMFVVSVASVGLQTTQDRLICIPAVNCSELPRNDSVVRRWSEFSDVLDTCNQSVSLVVLTKMPDRRQYDYVDNECRKKMHWLSAYFSLIFLAETALLLAISNFWQKFSICASALAHCEHLLLDFTKGDIFLPKDEVQQQPQLEQEPQQQKQAEQKLLKRLKVFEQCYSQKITTFNSSSVTWQYRVRGLVGIAYTIPLIIFNAIIPYSPSTEFTQCHLDGDVAFSTKHRFFQCTRSMEWYFQGGSALLLYGLFIHLCLVSVSLLWSCTGERRRPVYKITSEKGRPLRSDGDAASLSGHGGTPTIELTNLTCGESAVASLSGHESTPIELTNLTCGESAVASLSEHEGTPIELTNLTCGESAMASLSGHEGTPIELTNLTCDENAAASLSGDKSTVERALLTYVGDAAFLFHLIHESNYFLITVIRYLLEAEEEKERSA